MCHIEQVCWPILGYCDIYYCNFYFSEWEEMHSAQTEIDDISTDNAFITEEMLQSITTEAAPGSNINNLHGNFCPHRNQNHGNQLSWNSSTSLRNILLAHQHSCTHSTALDNREQTTDNEASPSCNHGASSGHGNQELHSNRSSLESNQSNNVFNDRNNMNENKCSNGNMNHNKSSKSKNRNNTLVNHVYENVNLPCENVGAMEAGSIGMDVDNSNGRTIEVSGCTNTSSTDSCIQNTVDYQISNAASGGPATNLENNSAEGPNVQVHSVPFETGDVGQVQVHSRLKSTSETQNISGASGTDDIPSNRTSGISTSSSSSAGLVETSSSLMGMGASGASGPVDRSRMENPEAGLNDVLFRFDRQFRVNSGFGFANWRWPHRLSHAGAGASTAEPADGASSSSQQENILQQQARWLRRLHRHNTNPTPTNSNSNSLRSNSSTSSHSGRNGNLQQEWYFYDPRLVPQHRTQRIVMETDCDRVHTTSYVSNIINPPTYDELVSGSLAHIQAGSQAAISEAPPSFDDMQMMEQLIPLPNPNLGMVPSEPPPPYMDVDMPPVYDIDPTALNDPPPQYDDHSFNGDENYLLDPMEPMDMRTLNSENENFILSQPTVVASESDGNFILSALPNLRSPNRQTVVISPDGQSDSDERDSVEDGSHDGLSDLDSPRSSGHMDSNGMDGDQLDDVDGLDTEGRQGSDGERETRLSENNRRCLFPLEELFQTPPPNTVTYQEETETDQSELSSDENGAISDESERSIHNRPMTAFPGYQLLHNSPNPSHWPGQNHVIQSAANGGLSTGGDLGEDTDDLVDDLPGQAEDNSRSLANFSSRNYPIGFLSGGGPPLRWSRGVGLGRWNTQNWAI